MRTGVPLKVALVATTLFLAACTSDDETATPTTTAAPTTTPTTSPAATSTTAANIPVASRTVPSVRGERLDVAKAHLRDAGYGTTETEVVGGGTFGAVNESNWTVCQQEPRGGTKGAARVRIVIDRTC